MELTWIITTIIAILGVIVAIWQILVNRRLQIKNLDLQNQMLRFQQEQEPKKELNKAIEKYNTVTTDAEVYCNHIIDKFRYLDFTGLNAILQKPLLLENVYVRLRAKESRCVPDYRSIADFNCLVEKDKENNTISEDFITLFQELHDKYEKKRKPLKLIILGQPGSGKTTLMKWIAIQCANHNNFIFSDFVPIFIPLKSFGRNSDYLYQTHNILELTIKKMEHENVSSTFVKEAFENNRLLFLLDGLDEVADEYRRREVIEWIQNQNIRKNTLIVTSRFSGLQESKGLKFPDAYPVFAIQDFDIADIERFLENWYRNIEIAVTGETDKKEAVPKGIPPHVDLLNSLKYNQYSNSKLHKLAVNPLLLTIIAIVHRTRAVLPKERHKLYEECLKVMIELWNIANKKLDVAFSVENSMDYLSKLAVYLMTHNRRELEFSEIKGILPPRIEDHSLDFFLNEMVLKAGLLYESEGKYGFLHLTFQEYLTAWHFSRNEDQNAVIEYRNEDFWTETFMLFVNLGNARQFFNEIMDNLIEKKYWEQIWLWSNCLGEIAVESTQKEIGIKLAKKVLSILPEVENTTENKNFIFVLCISSPLHKYAEHYIKESWNLFYNARHPLVQSVGSSILNAYGQEVQERLMSELKKRINCFEAEKDQTKEELLKFLYQNNNSFLFFFDCYNLTDTIFAINKLKSENLFIVYLCYVSLYYHINYKSHFTYLPSIPRFLSPLNDLRYKISTDPMSNLYHLDNYLDLYLTKYETLIKEHKPDIDAWVDSSIKTFQSFSDEDLLRYFTFTTQAELREFRLNYAPFIENELVKGNNDRYRENPTR